MRDLQVTLNKAVAAVNSSAAWDAWLDVAARWHQHSARNVFLIQHQAPTATDLASYAAWQERRYQVRKGEKGVRIFADTPSGTTTSTLFDITQTHPASPAQSATPDRAATPASPLPSLHALIHDRGWSVHAGQPRNGTHVDADIASRTITLAPDLDPPEQFMALAQQVGHLVLLRANPPPPPPAAAAASVSQIVGRAHGLDMTPYPIPGLVDWLRGNPERVQADADRILAAARSILAATLHHEPDQDRVQQLRGHAATQLQSIQSVRDRAELTAHGRQSLISDVTDAPDQLARLAATNKAAANFFAAHYQDSTGARDYVRSRLGSNAAPRGFVLGYAPDARTNLLDYLQQLGFSDNDLHEAGLVRRTRRGTLIDTFRDRVVLAVHDSQGRVAGFIGRPPHDSFDPTTPKYLNTPASPLFDKGRLLLGLHEQREALRAGATPVLVEGMFDVLAITQADGGAGRVAAAATSGTAVTAEHLASLTTTATADRLVLAQDADAAGQRAMLRAAELAVRTDKAVDVAEFADDSDPADWFRRYPADALGPYQPDRTRPALELIVDQRIATFDDKLEFVDGRVDAMRYAAAALAGLPPETASGAAVRIAEQLQMDPGHVARAIADASKSVRGHATPASESAAVAAECSPVTLSSALARPSSTPSKTSAPRPSHSERRNLNGR